MVVVAEFVGGAALGAAFGVLFDYVGEAMGMSSTFKSHLKNVGNTVRCLKPVMDEIKKQNGKLGIPDEEIIDFIKQMEDGAEIVRKLSKVSWWNCKKPLFTQELVELDASLKRLLDILVAQGVRDGKETLVLAKENNDQLVESGRDGKETLVLAKKNNDQLVESGRDGKETLVLAKKNNDQLVESARDGKETLVVVKNMDGTLKELETKMETMAKQITQRNPPVLQGKKVAKLVEAVGLGAALGELDYVVSDAKAKQLSDLDFRQWLDETYRWLTEVKGSLLKKEAENRKVLDIPIEQLTDFRIQIEKGIEFISKMPKVQVWTEDKKSKYINKFHDLHKTLDTLKTRLDGIQIQIPNTQIPNTNPQIPSANPQIPNINPSF